MNDPQTAAEEQAARLSTRDRPFGETDLQALTTKPVLSVLSRIQRQSQAVKGYDVPCGDPQARL